jgi:hypothetical protein
MYVAKAYLEWQVRKVGVCLGRVRFKVVEYDLKYEPLKAKKGQVVVDFIIDYSVEMESSVCMTGEESWTLFFVGSVCSQERGIGFLVISPHGMEYQFSTRLEFECINNQAEYEALLSGIEVMVEMGAKSVRIFRD